MKVLHRKTKYVVYVALATCFWGVPVQAGCYTWNPGDISTINLQDRENGYYRIWKDKKNLQLAAKLKHGSKIKIIRFIADQCGGDVYVEAKVKGRAIRGWTHSDNLFYLTR
jgi:hypothetical protein